MRMDAHQPAVGAERPHQRGDHAACLERDRRACAIRLRQQCEIEVGTRQPAPRQYRIQHELVVAPIAFKARRVVAPLVRALRANGRLMGVHAHGDDPGMEIIQSVWPGEDPFTTGRTALMDEVRSALGAAAPAYRFHELDDAESLFRYHIHTLSTEIAPKGEIGTSTLIAAWNAASYVAQIEDRRLAAVMNRDDYLDVTRSALRRHGGLWFNNETYIVSRRAELG